MHLVINPRPVSMKFEPSEIQNSKRNWMSDGDGLV